VAAISGSRRQGGFAALAVINWYLSICGKPVVCGRGMRRLPVSR
jgi:hypothetical protein